MAGDGGEVWREKRILIYARFELRQITFKLNKVKATGSLRQQKGGLTKILNAFPMRQFVTNEDYVWYFNPYLADKTLNNSPHSP